jgi:2,3-dihydroxybenzoate---[aryl-carrier protein] ligase
VGIIPVMALATHRYTEIQQFVRLSEAVGYAVPERVGDFAYTELAAHTKAHDIMRNMMRKAKGNQEVGK